MDVLRPTIVRIGKRCYRKYAVENSQDEEFEEGPVSSNYVEDEADYDEVCEAFANNIEETENGFKMTLDIPSNFFKYIIGKRGETKKRLENETRTQIRIPRQGSEGEIVVLGRDRSGLLSARTRIDILVGSARQREPFTHFLSIPVATDAIKESFEEFKANVCRFCSGDRGIDGTIFQNPNKLHLTLGTLVLLNEAEIRKAHDLLQQCMSEIVEPVLNGNQLVAMVKGLEYMNDDPCVVDVLYAKVQLQDESNRLQLVADQLVQHFTKSGFMQQSYDHVKLHVTVMNTLMRKDPSGASAVFTSGGNRSGGAHDNSRGGKERESFDASQILKLYGDFDFGLLHMESVQVSQRYGVGCTGYYACDAKLELP